MRKIYLLMALCLSFAITSCGDEENYDDIIVDYSPVEFYIFVENEDGVDLLNVQNEAALDLNTIKLYYKDKEYTLTQEESNATRACHPHFYGVKLEEKDGQCCLYVGEFEGGYDIELNSFTIDWGNGSVDTFSYSNKIIKPMEVERNFYYNGSRQSSKYITIIKK